VEGVLLVEHDSDAAAELAESLPAQHYLEEACLSWADYLTPEVCQTELGEVCLDPRLDRFR
jgi:hypothetical protein